MEVHVNTLSRVPGTRMEISASLWFASLWLRLGIAGMLLAGYGVAVLLGEGRVGPGLIIAAAGSVLATIGFRRSWRAFAAEANTAPAAPSVAARPTTRPWLA